MQSRSSTQHIMFGNKALEDLVENLAAMGVLSRMSNSQIHFPGT
jgi:hypothetical protein